MIDLEDIVKNVDDIDKYCSEIIWAKIGHAQIISHEVISSPEEEANDAVKQPMPYIRKILTTDKRVIKIEDFRDETGRSDRLLSMVVSSEVFSFGDKEPEEEGGRVSIMLPSPFRLKLKLEAQEEADKWKDIYKYSPDVPEECWAWWNGSIFLAYTTDPIEGSKDFGHKTRDTLRSLFRESDVFDVAYIGPTPIHPDVVILVFSKEKLEEYLSEADTLRLTREAVKVGEDIMIPVLVDSEAEVDTFIHEAARIVYGKLRRYMYQFYLVQMTRHFMMNASERCSTTFKGLIQELMEMQETPVYRFLARRRLSRSLGRLTSEIHMALIEEYEVRSHLIDDRGNLESSLGRDSPAYLLKEYFLEHTAERERIDRECISNALTHVDQEVGRHSAFNIQLLSALLGAAVAVGLMYAGAALIRLGSGS